MSDKSKDMVLASFAADSLALGAHWIYDTDEIEKKFGRVDRLLKPSQDSYHSTKDAGEFTHYGDQMLCLMEAIAEDEGFDPESFSQHWRKLFDGYNGYFDHATKDTLANLKTGEKTMEAGSKSSDLAGASRIAPLVYRYRHDPDHLVDAAGTQTALTHNHPQVIESARFFCLVALKALQGSIPSSAIQEVSEKGLFDDQFRGWLKAAMESAEEDTRTAVRRFGQSCSVASAFPSVIHLVIRHQNNIKEALIENVMAGGDSAARGMAVGMILGAFPGSGSIPEEWLCLKKYGEIVKLLEKIG